MPETIPTEQAIYECVLGASPESARVPRRWRQGSPDYLGRLLARLLDTLAHGVLAAYLFLALAMTIGSGTGYAMASSWVLKPGGFILFACIVSIPISALAQASVGVTLGKWLFGIRIADGKGFPLSFQQAARREFRVAVSGLGLGLPVLGLVAPALAGLWLRMNGQTMWDAGPDWKVRYRNHVRQDRLAWLLGATLLLGLGSWFKDLL